jgi:Domain of unknown function (DUF4124)
MTARILALLAVAVLAAAAHAELFRCTGPDGKPIYTDRKGTCPGAEASEPEGVVHHSETPDDPGRSADEAVPAARAGAPPAHEMEEQAAALWKQKKRDAEQRVEELHERREWIRRYVSYCNRGAWVTTRDDAGIQQVVNCTELHRELASLETQEAAVREYLATGLADECRRAGCLPGWVR